jgi:pyruvate,orthophosphate dikinase
MPAKKAKKKTATKAVKYSYDFGNKTDGSVKLRELLGGKGANLAEMARIGLPVPPGFTITTDVCTYFYANGRKYPATLAKEVKTSVAVIEKQLGKKLGAEKNPLLLSVRSGARESMPGMMDTVLNLGLNDVSVQGLIKQMGNERLGWDSYRRFIDMFGNVVMGQSSGLTHEHFEEAMVKIKKK